MATTDVLKQLHSELDREDPWRLDSSSFEQARYSAVLELLSPRRFESGLEVGCAAGSFTKYLAPLCTQLRAVDLIPEAIERCRSRLSEYPGISYSVADIANTSGWQETYDLIVVGDVFYYLESRAHLLQAVTKLKEWLRIGGILIFGSARDHIVKHWGLQHGAETVMREWSKDLRELKRRRCIGNPRNQDSLIVKYIRDV